LNTSPDRFNAAVAGQQVSCEHLGKSGLGLKDADHLRFLETHHPVPSRRQQWKMASTTSEKRCARSSKRMLGIARKPKELLIGFYARRRAAQ
jgi:hypothetical protein